MTRQADLAARTMVLLARGRRLKSSDLAEALDATAGFVPQVVGPLVKAGWVTSVPGPTGGYSLGIDLADVSILDVIEVTEGPTDHGRCVVADRPCHAARACLVHDAWAEARASLVDSLRLTSLADLARTDGGGGDQLGPGRLAQDQSVAISRAAAEEPVQTHP